MLYSITVLVNFITLAVAVWLGIYLVSRSPRSAVAWLAGLTLWSIAGFFQNVLLALNPPPSPATLPVWMQPLLWFWPSGAFEHGWGNWLQGWQITPAIMIWHHLSVQVRWGRMNRWRWTRVLIGYAIAVAAIFGQRYTPLLFSSVNGDPLYLTTLVPGPLYPVYMACLIVFITLSLVNLIRSARAAPTPMQRQQLNLMALATLIAGLSGPVAFVSYKLNFLLPRVTLSILIGCGMFLLGYGITRYSALIEGRFMGRDFLYNGGVTLLIASLYVLVAWVSVVAYGVPLAALSILVILPIITHSLVDVGRRAFDFVLYTRDAREMRAAFRTLSHGAFGPEALEGRLGIALETLCTLVDAAYGLILVFEEEEPCLRASYRWRNTLPQIRPEFLVSDDVHYVPAGLFPRPLDGAALLVPLYAGEHQQGVIILGPPKKAAKYDGLDIERLLDASDRMADLIRGSLREREHLAELSRLIDLPQRALAPEPGIPTKTVEDGLRNLFDYSYLADSPLATLKQVRTLSPRGTVTHLDRGKCVYQIMLDAVEKLRPPGDMPGEPIPRQWFPYLILHDAYMNNKSNNEIMMRLYISEGTFNRTRRAAIRSVARALEEIDTGIP
jgi:hypothetical protein